VALLARAQPFSTSFGIPLRMARNYGSKAGVLLFLGVAQFWLIETISETMYPNYNPATNYISDLGPPCSPGVACGSQSTWMLFDTSVIILGIAVLVAAYLLQGQFRQKPLTGLMGIAGLGAIGLGVFDESAPFMLHHIFSMIAFLAMGLAALVSFRLQKPPLGYFSIVLGLLSLISLVLYLPDTGVSAGGYLGIGGGGLERMIVYPVFLWALAWGGQLMASEDARMT